MNDTPFSDALKLQPALPAKIPSAAAERLDLARKALLHFKQPFRYEPEGQIILDAAGNRVVDVRGWGFLTGGGSGALGMQDAVAESVQNAIGFAVADFLNGP